MAYEVKYDDGGYCCHFSHGKKKYYADLRDTYDHGNECMIFREGTWNDLYCRRWIIDGRGTNRLHRSVHREDGRRSGKEERA